MISYRGMNINKFPAYNELKVYAGNFLFMQRVRELVAANLKNNIDGRGVNIAVLDTGLSNHPDLNGRVIGFHDFVGHRNQLYDNNGHGTHVCGILCGNGSLSAGRYRGMAPGANLVVGKVLDDKGDGRTETMLKGLDWILQVKEKFNIKILNISVGIGTLDEWEKERALQDKIDEVWESGILVVCAAGNKGPGDNTVSSVGSGRHVVTVGCHDGNYAKGRPDRCEAYSGRGMYGSLVRKPDLVAPGTDIISCNGYYRSLTAKNRKPYMTKSGTSMATPVVSGAAALVFQKYPDSTNEQCKQKLQFSATDLGLPWNQQGWGMLNVERLLL